MRTTSTLVLAGAALAIATLLTSHTSLAKDNPFEKCPRVKGTTESLKQLPGDVGDDLQVAGGVCLVNAGTFKWRHVNILEGGTLSFQDETIDFWADGILVEKGGALIAGTPAAPIGTKAGAVVTIHLYGKDQGASPFGNKSAGLGILCKSGPTCGVPEALWHANMNMATHEPVPVAQARTIDQINAEPYPGKTEKITLGADYFYGYHPLPFDDGREEGYFGYKVLGVSYGGTLKLFGKKGVCTSNCGLPSTTGQSWVRLAETLTPDEAGSRTRTLKLDAPVDWKKGDQIVVTTTDYLPGHSEQLTVAADTNNGTSVTISTYDDALGESRGDPDDPNAQHPPDPARTQKVRYSHNGQRYSLAAVSDGILDPTLKASGAETRAAVGLLTRSIRIVSEGNALGQSLNQAARERPEDGYFGGHVVIRQGFQAFQMQGVELYQLGQGGRLGHYPIHFHHARRTPKDTFVKDCAIHDSMTRWIVLHGTHDVTLARNVGYKSIGHGYYLEDASEINNTFDANLGILARAAVMNADGTPQRDNPRKVPGILAAPDREPSTQRSRSVERVPYRSDYDHPTVFWITNGWNDFRYNMAAGAGACGVAYWLLPAYNSTMSRDMKWTSYASMQTGLARAAMTPLKSFIGNSAVATQLSFNTVGDTAPCFGIGNPDPLRPDQPRVTPYLEPVFNRLAPDFPQGDPNSPAVIAARAALSNYYPNIDPGGGRFATQCGDGTDERDCSVLPKRCSSGGDSETSCMITKIDGYTSSFHWAEFNFAAMWLRPQWYLVTNSVLSDVQGGGLNFVTGGGYSASDRINGHWAVVQKSVFIGQSQGEQSVFALNGGPINPRGLQCAGVNDGNGFATLPGNYCLVPEEGVSFPISNFGMSQRLFSVYDGPAFQDSNAYLNIKKRVIDDCVPRVDTANRVGTCNPPVPWTDRQGLKRLQSHWLAGLVQGLPKMKQGAAEVGYMPNAAIGWKQPNGFYYPPAFHSDRLFFGGDVEIRHFVIEPVFREPTPAAPKLFITAAETTAVSEHFTLFNTELFKGFTDVDRQTVLNDDDGSLTGYRDTISVNLDPFFTGPREVIECLSDATARTSPYEHVTTVIYPRCAVEGTCSRSYEKPPIPNPHEGDWDRACSSPECYGVPLVRQHLTKADGGEAKSIFMMGQAIGQRNSLTVNHGTYYVDTTKGRRVQEQAVYPPNNDCNISVFRKGEVYNLFLIFGKPSTKQTYQIFVGKNAAFDAARDVWITQADIRIDPIKFTDGAAPPASWKPTYDRGTGILTVTLDFGAVANLDVALKSAREENCRPKTFCEWKDDGNAGAGSCREIVTKSEGVCRWAVKDVDCPSGGGCYGIGFRLPPEFSTDPATDPRPAPVCLKTTDADFTSWNVPMAAVAASLAGNCPPQGEVPRDGFCDSP
ncbi:MAG: G8 domain-containing protein [Thermoanaerobaculia bacterium]